MLETDKRIKLIQNKVVETEKIYQKDRDSLGELSDRLVKLIADNMIKPSDQKKKEIEGITGQIGELKNKIELSPKIINALKEKINLLEKEKADQILQGKIDEQKKISIKLGEVSKNFVKNLKLIIEENKEIRGLWSNFNTLKEETKYNKLDQKVSMYSDEMLELVCGTLVGEYDLGKIRKQSVFNRIRL